MSDSRKNDSKEYNWNRQLDLIDQHIIVRIDQALDEIFADKKKIKAEYKRIAPLNIPALIAKYDQYAKDQKKLMMEAIQNAIDTASEIIQMAIETPVIYRIQTLPINNLVEPGTHIVIYGSNFGDKPGHVNLSYTYSTHENTAIEFITEEPDETIEDTISLHPYQNSWEHGWSSNLIIVRATRTYEKLWINKARTGEIKVVLADGTILTETITVGAGHPYISSLKTVAGRNKYYDIRPGEEFIAKGRNFGDVQGQAELSVCSGGDRIWRTNPQGDMYCYDYLDSDNIKNFEEEFIGLSILDWNEYSITLKTNNYNPKEFFYGGRGYLRIENSTGRSYIFDKIHFGPDTEFKMVSGIEWADKDVQKAATITPSGAAMVVTHKPDCSGFLGIGQSGEEGNDWFFNQTPWPPTDVLVRNFYFKWLNPDDGYDDWDFLKEKGQELFEAVNNGPLGWAEYAAENIFGSIFGGGTGGYHAYVSQGPGEWAWTFDNIHSIRIDWESDCALGGNPIRYIVFFIIQGTKQALEKYKGVTLSGGFDTFGSGL
jgi:hypothetical protein